MSEPHQERFVYETVNGIKRLLYKGVAEAGKTSCNCAFRICKYHYDEDGNVDGVLWASGHNGFVHKWDSRKYRYYS